MRLDILSNRLRTVKNLEQIVHDELVGKDHASNFEPEENERGPVDPVWGLQIPLAGFRPTRALRSARTRRPIPGRTKTAFLGLSNGPFGQGIYEPFGNFIVDTRRLCELSHHRRLRHFGFIRTAAASSHVPGARAQP
jgi:hypothetical protein